MRHQVSLYVASDLADAGLPDVQRYPTTDVEHVVVSKLTIDAVRQLIETAYRAPLEQSERHIVIVAQTITREAQNALLKVLEEPPSTTCFALVVPSIAHLLPTVLSRVQVVETGIPPNKAGSFMYKTYAERLAYIQAAAKEKQYDQLREALVECYEWASSNRATAPPRLYTVVNTAILRAQEPGASIKMLSEQVALEFPIVSKE